MAGDEGAAVELEADLVDLGGLLGLHPLSDGDGVGGDGVKRLAPAVEDVALALNLGGLGGGAGLDALKDLTGDEGAAVELETDLVDLGGGGAGAQAQEHDEREQDRRDAASHGGDPFLYLCFSPRHTVRGDLCS